jgi:hypothetical protein
VHVFLATQRGSSFILVRGSPSAARRLRDQETVANGLEQEAVETAEVLYFNPGNTSLQQIATGSSSH